MGSFLVGSPIRYDRRQLKKGENQLREGPNSGKRHVRQHEHGAGREELEEGNPEDAFGDILDRCRGDRDHLVAAFPGQPMDQFPHESGRSIGSDKKYAGDGHRDEKHEKSPAKTAQRPDNSKAQLRQGFPVGRDNRFQTLGSQQPYFRNRLPDQGPSRHGRVGGRDRKGLVPELGRKSLYSLDQRADKQCGRQQDAAMRGTRDGRC